MYLGEASTQTQADRKREADEYFAATSGGNERRYGDAAALRRNDLKPAILSLRHRALAQRRQDAAP
jgi:hypothetical protein